MDTVDIVIPVYNVQKYLPQCLESLVAQIYSHWRAILVDDGSTEESGRICDEYAAKDSRFIVIHQKNGGAASAKNTALARVCSSYVGFVDSDDYVEPMWLKRVMQVCTDENADVVEYRFDKVFRDGTELPGVPSTGERVYTASEYLGRYLEDWTASLFWKKIFRAELMTGVQFKRERRCIDDEFFTYKAISRAKKIVCIDDVLYHYRQRASSAVANTSNKLQITNDAMDVLIERYQYVCDRFPQLRQIYLRHDVEIMFFFADFRHDADSARKFRRIARFYLGQCLRHFGDGHALYNAIRLQAVSTRRLLASEESKTVDGNLSRYFD